MLRFTLSAASAFLFFVPFSYAAAGFFAVSQVSSQTQQGGKRGCKGRTRLIINAALRRHRELRLRPGHHPDQVTTWKFVSDYEQGGQHASDTRSGDDHRQSRDEQSDVIRQRSRKPGYDKSKRIAGGTGEQLQNT